MIASMELLIRQRSLNTLRFSSFPCYNQEIIILINLIIYSSLSTTVTHTASDRTCHTLRTSGFLYFRLQILGFLLIVENSRSTVYTLVGTCIQSSNQKCFLSKNAENIRFFVVYICATKQLFW